MKASVVSSHPVLHKTLSLLLLVAVFASCILMGGATAASAESPELSPADLYEKNVVSTVGITTSGKINSRFGGYTFQAAGSGFIITEDGYILTNHHVIDGSDTVTVATFDEQTYDAKVIGYDESSDIAILKVEATNLKPVTVGDSDQLRVGDPVYAIGNPLGELTFSLTHGIVSALSRNVKTGSHTMNLIQTDCAINSGNSGGALFNSRGEVVGITNAKYSASGFSNEAEIDNVGFAIPVNSVTRIVTSIIENGYVLKPYIGITVAPLSEETASITGIKAGAVVQDVTEGAPADQAGIKVHDVIVKIDDVDIKDSNTLVQAVAKSEPGDVMTFTVYRQGEEIKLDVEIGSKTESALKDEEEAAESTPVPQEQMPQEWQQGIPGWSNNPFEDFFDFYFGY
ncbi:MAG: trypsin-like peptidase domain-containing protein [Oscillospiraceae bacterium]|nr:trypsin-like peptidase domain-containing protein [Oscillospiraceae bacterium]